MGMGEGFTSYSTTCIHLDMSDAINLMLVGTACWRFFPQDKTAELEMFLKEIYPEADANSSLIHDQTCTLTTEQVEEFEAINNCKVYTIIQRQGDAIFIPCGVAHQVTNVTNCVKIACDFVSVYNVEECLNVTEEFRNLVEGHERRQDLLQFKKMAFLAYYTRPNSGISGPVEVVRSTRLKRQRSTIC